MAQTANGKRTRVVIALGGNALGDTPAEQIERVRTSAPALLGVIDDDNVRPQPQSRM